ncbi:MAG: alpha-L-fucosidase [Ruminococcaceae bacterium]|nr:alpha-L-fucosidase [Oscillospiraceae bacterium]
MGNQRRRTMVEIVNGVHGTTDEKDVERDYGPEVAEHIEWFKDQKLGFMMHWAPGTQFGIVESWALAKSAEWEKKTEATWMTSQVNWVEDLDEFRESYVNAYKTFNPIKFNPEKWARMAKECGFKYLLATTKHHDGFCMYDSKYTNHKITADDCPFHTNKNADIVGALYKAFRAEGLGISTYFSKPDWGSPYFWSPDFPNKHDVAPNYDINEHPELWEKFVEYTQNQLFELTSNYGKIDVLWLDGGWVSADSIRLGEVIDKIRATTQPHLIVADRCGGGKYENFLTPEQHVPSQPLHMPWESCITIADGFAFGYDKDLYLKTPKTLVHLIIDIVAKGGNLALNVTPQPDGELPAKTLETLNEIGHWLKINGEGIYGTRPIAPYAHDEMAYTQKNGNIYAFLKYSHNYYPRRNAEIFVDKPVKDIVLLRTGESVPFKQDGKSVIINTMNFPLYDLKYADCLKVYF